MFIVYVIGTSSETMLFEDKKEAFSYALEVAKELGGDTQVKIYKATLIGIAEQSIHISKVRKQKIVKPKVFEAAKNRLIEKKKERVLSEDLPSHLPPAVRAANKPKPILSQELLEIAQDAIVPPEMDEVEENDIPVGARCALDRNMAVGKKKGPTGEFVYLCLDCMGAITNG